jgi:hypothetical protein
MWPLPDTTTVMLVAAISSAFWTFVSVARNRRE